LSKDFPEYHFDKNHGAKLVELGALAKAKNAVVDANASLASITAVTLQQNLSKDVRSSEWTAPTLTEDQIEYAALDAWVSFPIWDVLKTQKNVGEALEAASPVGQLVSLLSRKKEVARGVIVPQPLVFTIQHGSDDKFDVNVTKTRVVIEIDEVLAPAVLLSLHKKSLGDIQAGQTSFQVIVSLSALRTRASSAPDQIPISEPVRDPEESIIILPSSTSLVEVNNTEIDVDDDIESDIDEFDSLEVQDNNSSDSESGYIQPLASETQTYPSRILADVFHEMQKVCRTISRKHSLNRKFAVAFSDTLLVPSKSDKANLIALLAMSNKKWDVERLKRPGWIWARVRRFIPAKDLLHKILTEFFQAWASVKCTKTGQMLFNDETWKAAHAVLHDVQKGWVSDPVGIPLYTVSTQDKNGLNIYHCIRGTNSVEGAVHNPIRRSFASLNASVELADCLIADFRHRHNLDVGTLHKTGYEYKGHYDQWLDHEISKTRCTISWKSKPVERVVLQETDALDFNQTVEQFGITRIPDQIRLDNNFCGAPIVDPITKAQDFSMLAAHVYPMKLHLSYLSGSRKDVYSYLAAAQSTKYAVVPIHTEEEKRLFCIAIGPGGPWAAARGQPKFDEMVAWWSDKADGKTIFYKLYEHLVTHYKIHKDYEEQRNTLVSSRDQRHANETRIRSSTHVAEVLAPADRIQPGVVIARLAAQNIMDPPMATISYTSEHRQSPDVDMVAGPSTLSHHENTIIESTGDFVYNTTLSVQANQGSHSQWSSRVFSAQMATDLPTDTLNIRSYSVNNVPKPRKPRTCVNCKKAGKDGSICPGKDRKDRCITRIREQV